MHLRELNLSGSLVIFTSRDGGLLLDSVLTY